MQIITWKRTILISVFMVCLAAMKIMGVELDNNFLMWFSAPITGYVVAKGANKGEQLDVAGEIRGAIKALKVKNATG
jgi:hypothetical protein